MKRTLLIMGIVALLLISGCARGGYSPNTNTPSYQANAQPQQYVGGGCAVKGLPLTIDIILPSGVSL